MDSKRIEELREMRDEYRKKYGYRVVRAGSVFMRGSRAGEEFVIVTVKNLNNPKDINAIVLHPEELKENYREIIDRGYVTVSDILIDLPRKERKNGKKKASFEENVSQPQE